VNLPVTKLNQEGTLPMKKLRIIRLTASALVLVVLPPLAISRASSVATGANVQIVSASPGDGAGGTTSGGTITALVSTGFAIGGGITTGDGGNIETGGGFIGQAADVVTDNTALIRSLNSQINRLNRKIRSTKKKIRKARTSSKKRRLKRTLNRFKRQLRTLRSRRANL